MTNWDIFHALLGLFSLMSIVFMVFENHIKVFKQISQLRGGEVVELYEHIQRKYAAD